MREPKIKWLPKPKVGNSEATHQVTYYDSSDKVLDIRLCSCKEPDHMKCQCRSSSTFHDKKGCNKRIYEFVYRNGKYIGVCEFCGLSSDVRPMSKPAI